MTDASNERNPEQAPADSLAARARGLDRLLGPLILASGLLLLLGWTLPIMTIDRFLFLSERLSILEACLELWAEGHYFLFAIIFVFTVVFPILKLTLALRLWYRRHADSAALGRHLGWMETLGRWSMLDVFVVALIVVAVQVSLISDVAIHAGIYVFTAAIVLSMLAVQRIARLTQRAVRLQERAS
ncbi:MAG: paraquat-inducible protein A [Kiloniellales bacterium]|nr:paraquat-inducible protein A [Kiloniellales bacterium]